MRVNGAPTNSIRHQARRPGHQQRRQHIVLAKPTQPTASTPSGVTIQAANYSAAIPWLRPHSIHHPLRGGNAFHDLVTTTCVSKALYLHINPSITSAIEIAATTSAAPSAAPFHPKIYNSGTNKTFFFFAYEQFVESTIVSNTGDDQLRSPIAVAAISPASSVAGPSWATPRHRRSRAEVLEGMIFDPASPKPSPPTARPARNSRQQSPRLAMDRPSALKLSKRFCFRTSDHPRSCISNFVNPFPEQPRRRRSLLSKVDHSFNSNLRISGYYSTTTRSEVFPGGFALRPDFLRTSANSPRHLHLLAHLPRQSVKALSPDSGTALEPDTSSMIFRDTAPIHRFRYGQVLGISGGTHLAPTTRTPRPCPSARHSDPTGESGRHVGDDGPSHRPSARPSARPTASFSLRLGPRQSQLQIRGRFPSPHRRSPPPPRSPTPAATSPSARIKPPIRSFQGTSPRQDTFAGFRLR